MRTLLAIIAHPRDKETLFRHWKFFKMLGWPILGCGIVGGGSEWPEDVMRLDTGVEGTRMTPAGSVIWGLVQQELDIIEWFLSHPEYDSVAIVEADNLFVRKPPEHPGGGLYLVTLMPNYSPRGFFSTPFYWSTPRWLDRACATVFLPAARRAIMDGRTEHFVSDRFPAAVCHREGIQWLAQPAWSPSPFHFGLPTADSAWVRDARAAIKMGCYCLHSVKTEKQLDALKDLLPCLD